MALIKPKQSGDDPESLKAALKPPNLVAQADSLEISDSQVPEGSRPEGSRRWRRLMTSAAPSWLISLVLHVVLVLMLAMVTLDPVGNFLSIIEGGLATSEVSLDEFSLEGMDVADPETSMESNAEPMEANPQQALSQLTPPTLQQFEVKQAEGATELMTDKMIDRSLLRSSTAMAAKQMLSSRSAASKSALLERYGGSAESEKSVALALKWIADHQIRRGPRTGAWSFDHNFGTREKSTGQGDFVDAFNAATAMALLPFLGAGQTHLEGQYKQTVKLGLSYLVSHMKVSTAEGQTVGSWHESRGNTYSHALAAIAVCEAYAMTQDPDLLQAAQLSLNFLVQFQDPKRGGWKYSYREPGDTSVVGWCLMALKSGRMGGLLVPSDSVAKAYKFLDSVSTDDGAFYGYEVPSATPGVTLTSVGMLCRMYQGWPKDHPGILGGVEMISKTGPKYDDLYYTYYATQVLRHFGGEDWLKWNAQTRDLMINKQIKEGVDAGSWDPEGRWSVAGGRLYQTSLATMILEVYYRHLPLYSEKTVEDDFEI